MSEIDDQALRGQLLEARERIRRELERLLVPSTIGGNADNHSVVAALEAELAEIESALSSLS